MADYHRFNQPIHDCALAVPCPRACGHHAVAGMMGAHWSLSGVGPNAKQVVIDAGELDERGM